MCKWFILTHHFGLSPVDRLSWQLQHSCNVILSGNSNWSNWNLRRCVVTVVASSRLSKSVKYSAVTLERNSVRQFLEVNSSLQLWLMFPLRDYFWLLNNKSCLRQNNFCIVVRQATTSACQWQKQALLVAVTLTITVAPKDFLLQPLQPFLGNSNVGTKFHCNQFTGCWDISVWTDVADRLSIPRAVLLTWLNQNPLVIPACVCYCHFHPLTT